MTSLFVLTADADQRAVLATILKRSFRHTTSRIEAHPDRDSGMVHNGPEFFGSAAKKGAVEKVLLIWDHAGSGRERQSDDKVDADLALRLDHCTWKSTSAAIAILPELEEWLW